MKQRLQLKTPGWIKFKKKAIILMSRADGKANVTSHFKYFLFILNSTKAKTNTQNPPKEGSVPSLPSPLSPPQELLSVRGGQGGSLQFQNLFSSVLYTKTDPFCPLILSSLLLFGTFWSSSWLLAAHMTINVASLVPLVSNTRDYSGQFRFYLPFKQNGNYQLGSLAALCKPLNWI